MPKSANDRRHFIIVSVLIAIGTVVLYWLLETVLPLPAQASVESLTIDQLIRWHLWLIAFLFSLVVVFMLYAIIIFRRREGDDTEGEHFEGNTTLEILWTAIPLALVVIFAFIGIDTLNRVVFEDPNEVTVKAVGFQWGWRFEYPTGVQSQELVLPVDRRVRMELETQDVNHAFWIPEFRVKQDLLAGQTNELRFTPTMTSADYEAEHGREIRLVCAELCGRAHWSMYAVVKVVPEAEYTAWLDEQFASQAPGVAQK
ncbi:MAG: cytochrome c oxidase subunit II [Chloroflexi bacterium]|nr:MAG: cytochrome c oxidase subunit II [Chloroflexota bacterium]